MRTQEKLSELIGGYRSTALLHVAATLGLADLIASGVSEAGPLARRLSVPEEPLHRLLRGLAALEILREEAPRRFALTELGAAMRGGAAGSFREQAIIAGEEYLAAWGGLLHTVQTSETAFAHVFGMSAWDHRQQNPVLGAAFDAALSGQTAALGRAIAEAYDFSRARVVMDIGGGAGGLLHALLARHPALEGVLFDRPHVVARCVPFAGRLRTVGGDFFAQVPAGADLYVLKSVLHDWDDAACRTILGHCRRAMQPEDRLLIIERALPQRVTDDPETIMLDVHMLAVPGGRERFPQEYQRLAEEAGLDACGVLVFATSFRILEFQARA
jgi:hypothetical protein